MKKLLCLILALLLILPPLPAQAWSEGGHHPIAVLAFRTLPAEKQQELIRILKTHPCFEQDFKLPSKVRNADEWLIGRAGYWPVVPNLDSWWTSIEAKSLADRFPGVKLKPPTQFAWGREVHFIDLAGVCWHVMEKD